MAVRHSTRNKEDFREEVEKNLLGFPLVNILCYLKESGLHEQLLRGGVPVDDQAAFRYGKDKFQAGHLGFLYATKHLDKKKIGNQTFYVLARNTAVTERNIEAAMKLRTYLRYLENGWDNTLELAVEDFPHEVRVGLAVPLISVLSKQLAAFDGKAYSEMRGALSQLGLMDGNELTDIGDKLYKHHVIGSFRALISSYRRLINRLHQASRDTKKLSYGNELARDEEENAGASNMLIANIIKTIRTYMEDTNIRRVLDLGSGGGFFLLGLQKETILFDRSRTTNEHAVKKFSKHEHLLKGVITGSILDRTTLLEARKKNPDAVTINYILHDILGQTPDYKSGLMLVKQFLLLYKEVFGDTPLLITESWSVGWDDLREGGKPHITAYAWIHEISPQRLMSPQVLAQLLQEAGFIVEKRITHGKMPIRGKEAAINETWVVRTAHSR